MAGRAIVGLLNDTTLEVLPSTTTSWQSWTRLHPNTLVLSRITGYRRDYDRDPFRGYTDKLNRGQFPFPFSYRRYRPLNAGTMVIVTRIGNDARAYPIEADDVALVHDAMATNRSWSSSMDTVAPPSFARAWPGNTSHPLTRGRRRRSLIATPQASGIWSAGPSKIPSPDTHCSSFPQRRVLVRCDRKRTWRHGPPH